MQELQLKDKYARAKELFEIIFLAILGYCALASIEGIIVKKSFFALTILVPGKLSSHAWPILVWTGIILLFYKKFGWKSVSVFFLANSVDELCFQFSYDVLYPLIYGKPPILSEKYGWTTNPVLYLQYHGLVLIETLIQFGIALYILKPWKTFRPNIIGYLAMVAWFWTYALVMPLGYPVTIYPEFNQAFYPNVGDVIGLLALPTFIFTSIRIKEKSYLKRNAWTFIVIMSLVALASIAVLKMYPPA